MSLNLSQGWSNSGPNIFESLLGVVKRSETNRAKDLADNKSHEGRVHDQAQAHQRHLDREQVAHNNKVDLLNLNQEHKIDLMDRKEKHMSARKKTTPAKKEKSSSSVKSPKTPMGGTQLNVPAAKSPSFSDSDDAPGAQGGGPRVSRFGG